MKDTWTGRDQRLKMEGRGIVAKAVNAFIFIKQQHFIMRAMRACPDWVTPNRVTAFRLVLAVPAVLAIVQGDWWTAFVVSAVSLLLDFVDGALAEAKNLKTKLGAILDPLADKVFVVSLLAAMWPQLAWYWQIVAAGVIVVEVIIGGIRLLAMRSDEKEAKKVIIAGWSGKLKMVLESAGLIVALLGLCVASPVVFTSGFVLIALSVPVGAISIYTKVVP